MAVDQTGNWTGSIIERIKTILGRPPKEAWQEIDRDMTPSGELLTRFAMPLAALAPVGGFIFGRIWGWNPFGINIFGQLFTAVIGYGLSMAAMVVMSLISAKLAPRFGGEGSPRDAFKLIIYSSTAAWLASAAATIPGMGFLGIASLYSLYLYFTGIGPIMKVPEENKKKFGIVTICCAIGLNMAAGLISSGPAMLFGSHNNSWQQRDYGREARENIEFDEKKFGDFGREVREAMQKGKNKAVAPNDLQALLPLAIGNYKRTSTESSTMGPFGSRAQGTYEDDGQEFTLRIVDMAGMAKLGSAFTITKNREDEDGFERVNMHDGQLVVEKWENDDDEGKYQTTVDRRFFIEADGEADNIGELKSAVATIDQGKLKALEK